MAKKKVQDQGERLLRNEAYFAYAVQTKDEAQRRYRAFCEAIEAYQVTVLEDGQGTFIQEQSGQSPENSR